MRHAYLLLIHANLRQVRTLMRCLDDERNDIYIHIDASSDIKPADLQDACHKASVAFVASEKISWGGVSIVRAEMRLLAEAVKKEHAYYHLLSGMDMPLKTQDYIHRYFEENAGLEYVESYEPAHHTLLRVQYPTAFPEGSRQPLTNILNHIGKYLCLLLGRKINVEVDFRKGSQWFSITHAFASYIVSQAEWVEHVFARTTICDEFLVQTLLEASPFKKNHVNDNLRLIEMGRGSSIRHPYTYTMADHTMLKQSAQLWARKFDESVDEGIIQALANELSPL